MNMPDVFLFCWEGGFGMFLRSHEPQSKIVKKDISKGLLSEELRTGKQKIISQQTQRQREIIQPFENK